MPGVFDGQVVEPKLLLHLAELGLVGVAQGHPHEAVGAAHVVVNLLLGDVGQLLAVLVGDAVDEHWSPLAGIIAQRVAEPPRSRAGRSSGAGQGGPWAPAVTALPLAEATPPWRRSRVPGPTRAGSAPCDRRCSRSLRPRSTPGGCPCDADR